MYCEYSQLTPIPSPVIVNCQVFLKNMEDFMKSYRYVGPADITKQVALEIIRKRVTCGTDVLSWIERTGQTIDPTESVVATFVVDTNGLLWISDRRSEHVCCARGSDVLAAGEILFSLEHDSVCVSHVTNQSTGYCPEPDSWAAVHKALARAGIEHPETYTLVFVFRRCSRCNQINIVKEGLYECATCGATLDRKWNFA